jgi:hypothetical protein
VTPDPGSPANDANHGPDADGELEESFAPSPTLVIEGDPPRSPSLEDIDTLVLLILRRLQALEQGAAEPLPQASTPVPAGVVERVTHLVPTLVEPYVVLGLVAVDEGRLADAMAPLIHAESAGTRDPFALLELARLVSPRSRIDGGWEDAKLSLDAGSLLDRVEELGRDLDDITPLVQFERACIRPEAEPELVPWAADTGLRTRRTDVRRIIQVSVFAAYPGRLADGGRAAAGHLIDTGLAVAPRDPPLRLLELLHRQDEASRSPVAWEDLAEALFDMPLPDTRSVEPASANSASEFAEAARRAVEWHLRPLHGVRSLRRPPPE